MGREILLFEPTGDGSEFGLPRTVNAIPGRTLPADDGRSGSLVLRFGGVSFGKSGISSGRTGARGRGLGELGRDEGAEFRPLVLGIRETDVKPPVAGIRPTEGKRPTVGAEDGVIDRRVGVDDRELGRATVGFVFAVRLEVIRGLEDGVDGLEFCKAPLDGLEVRRGLDVGVDGLEFCEDPSVGLEVV